MKISASTGIITRAIPKVQAANADTDLATLSAVQQSQIILWFGPDGTVLDVNGRFTDATGYTASEIAGRPFDVLISDAQEADAGAFWKDMRAGRTRSGEKRLLSKAGVSIWLEAILVPVLSADGRLEKVGMFGFDISDRKLSKSDHADQMAAIAKSHAVIEFDLDGFILSANENFLKAVGYELEEIQGRHHRLFVHEQEARSEEYASFWRQLRSGRFQVGEFSRVTKQRETVWFQASYSPIFNQHGEVTRIVKYATDISGAKARSEDLQGQIRALSNSQMTIELLLDGTIVTANQNFLSTFGYDLSEVQGQHHRMFVTPQEAGTDAYLKFWETLARGQFQSAIYKRIARDGREVWIQASYNPILDKHGRPFKVVKFATDVTEAHAGRASKPARVRKKDDRDEARTTSALVRRSISDAPNGMALLDAAGTFLHVNPALCELFHASAEGLLGRRLDDFMAAGDALLASQRVQDLLKGKTELVQEERALLRQDQSEAWMMLHLTRERNRSGDDMMLVLQVQDISERHAVQQQQVDFISTVSHELRTPLTSIKGALGLILASKQVQLDPAVERLVSIAVKNSDRLAHLVNDLLDMEKLSSGQAQFQLAEWSVNELLEQAITINQPYGSEFGVTYRLDLPASTSWIRTDADRFHQVMSNLMSNATKFTPRESQVRVVGAMSEGSFRIGIIDAGPGIPEEFKSRIFRPFSQADSSDTRPKGGTGLGLNISRQIVFRMGGEIGYQNLPEGGCEFWFTVPTIKAPRS